jgi:phytoene desaturase
VSAAGRRVVVVGAGVGGLAAAVRLAHAGADVLVLEQGPVPGGKCGRLERGPWRWDTGPSLLTMPWVFRELFAESGAPLEEEVELLRVEPVTRYAFADGTRFDMSADLPRALEALEAWSPGAGADWTRFLGVCAGMWRASLPFLEGPPPWPPRRPAPGAPPPDPRDLLRVRPWHTVSTLARALVRDPRLRMVVERFATYAGADPRRAPAALAVAGYVEHAFGAWHPRGGIYELVGALVRRLEALGGELRCGVRAERIEVREGRVRAVDGERADAVVFNGDAATLPALLGRPAPARARERSVSGLALLLGLDGRTPDLPHHAIHFPADYHAEHEAIFARGELPADPTLYVSAPIATDPTERAESWFVLVNAPAGERARDLGAGADRLVALLHRRAGLDPGRVRVRAVRGPADLERETGAAGGAIYGVAPHGRLGTLRRPAPTVRGVQGLHLVGGTTHPGGGLPLVALSGRAAARAIVAGR